MTDIQSSWGHISDIVIVEILLFQHCNPPGDIPVQRRYWLEWTRLDCSEQYPWNLSALHSPGTMLYSHHMPNPSSTLCSQLVHKSHPCKQYNRSSFWPWKWEKSRISEKKTKMGARNTSCDEAASAPSASPLHLKHSHCGAANSYLHVREEKTKGKYYTQHV